mgnify:CR=1 FL=1
MPLDRLQKTLARMRPRGDASTRKFLWPRTNAFVKVLLGALHERSQALTTLERTLASAREPAATVLEGTEIFGTETKTESPRRDVKST